jgi:hypothetical protein
LRRRKGWETLGASEIQRLRAPQSGVRYRYSTTRRCKVLGRARGGVLKDLAFDQEWPPNWEEEGCFVRPKSNRRTESQVRKSRKRIMHACPTPRMPRRKYIQKVFTLIEIVIVFVVVAFLLAATVPGFLHARKRPQALKIPGGLRTTDPAPRPNR